MTRLKTVIIVAILGVTQIAAANNLSDDLNRDYQKHILGVRYAIHKGNQEFDNAGKPVNPGPAPAWEIYGGVFIEKLSLTDDQLRIEGMRVVLPDPTQKEAVAIPLGKVHFEIHLDHPLGSMDEARAVLGRVFYMDENDREHRKPELRRTARSASNPTALRAAQGTPGFVAPKPIYTPEPEFSDEARRAKMQGTVQLNVLVDAQGTVAAVRVDRGAGYGLDENAMDTVKDWRFTPATKDGTPVSLWLEIHVSFNLYSRRPS